MPDTRDDQQNADKNQSIIDRLRAEFVVMTQHLGPDLEPATIYFAREDSTEDPE